MGWTSPTETLGEEAELSNAKTDGEQVAGGDTEGQGGNSCLRYRSEEVNMVSQDLMTRSNVAQPLGLANPAEQLALLRRWAL